jgi:chemotaxis family two-component system response regulator Rcp1
MESRDASPALKIWLVEDSATDVYVIREVLRAAEFECDLRVITDGDAALSWLEEVDAGEDTRPPDLVMLDLNLPKVPGIEVLSALRRSPSMSKVPVVIVTSSNSPSDLKAIRDRGATAYFRKPHNLDEFMTLPTVLRQALDGQGNC